MGIGGLFLCSDEFDNCRVSGELMTNSAFHGTCNVYCTSWVPMGKWVGFLFTHIQPPESGYA